MYVCIYRGRPWWRCPWDRAFQLGLGEGPIGIVDPISQPRDTIDTASSTLICTHAHRRFPNQLYSRQLRETCFLIYKGAESHRGRRNRFCPCQRRKVAEMQLGKMKDEYTF